MQRSGIRGIPRSSIRAGFVLVHVGYAIQKIGAEQARETWELFDGILAGEPAGAWPLSAPSPDRPAC